ncbi:tyrosine-type recombinase/integrase [Marinimicrobium sp. ABcell2]|uniref:tyrosine-type recombinase/integrase n=1 Tax=Marinimicrobium sp. ABcell2 TaxID=3069751 RepID=UPI0027B3EF63|nr:tyrosine-type recombinase/integrase [Marinimicrobium sp. ABcell2]MDQ2077372.1 tyrosine-type recombinase/integrase [Marinimicrobium sp. ABcell2]
MSRDLIVNDTVKTLGSVSEQQTGVRNPALLYLMSSESQATKQVRRSNINRIVAYLKAPDMYTCNWTALRREHVFAILAAAREDGLSAHSLRGYLSTLKGIAREAWLSRLIGDGEYARIKDIKSPKMTRIPKGRVITGDEIRRLIQAALTNTGPKGVRDAAMIALMRGAGPRRNEVLLLTLKDYAPDAATIRVIGKGNKQRELPLAALVKDYLNVWLRHRGLEPGALFCGVIKSGRLRRDDEGNLRSLSTSAIGKMVESLALKAGIFEKTTPHDFRKTFATTLLDDEVDISSVQEALGHTSIDTTRLYDLSRQKRMMAIGEKVDIFR